MVVCAAITQGAPAQQLNTFLTLTVDGHSVSGHVLHATKNQVVLLRSDGALLDLDPAKTSDYKRTAAPFVPLSAGRLSAQLQAELGREFEVTGTGHYLVAHPQGEGALWAERFEDLYRETVQYFRVRGLQMKQPAFPLVAIVWPTQEDFLSYARRDGLSDARGVLGYYSRLSNRITLYDVTRGNANASEWQTNAETIIHEAVHQSAFNCGLHRRHGGSPYWIVEGLGTMFEARGINSSAKYPHMSDRINKMQLEAFTRYRDAGRQSGNWARLVMSDVFFNVAPLDAYAESWAFSFFLSETRPKQYAKIIELTAAKPAYHDYTAAERWSDFASVFGDDVRRLESQFIDFVDSLR